MSKASDLRIVEAASKDVDELHARISSEVGISEAKHARGDRRHAELAALVQEVTVALETLQRRVEEILHPPPPAVKPYWSPPTITMTSNASQSRGPNKKPDPQGQFSSQGEGVT